MLIVVTDDPKSLRKAIIQAASEGTLKTWELGADGALTHTANGDQWKGLAGITLTAVDGQLRCWVTLKSQAIATAKKAPQRVYAIYVGRFSEMLSAHFADQFSVAAFTPEPVKKPAPKLYITLT